MGSHIILTEADIFWKYAAEQRPAHDAAAISASQAFPENGHVTINNCTIAGANSEFLSCIAKDQTAGRQILINAENLPAADMLRARKLCSGWVGSRVCEADVTGKAISIGSY